MWLEVARLGATAGVAMRTHYTSAPRFRQPRGNVAPPSHGRDIAFAITHIMRMAVRLLAHI